MAYETIVSLLTEASGQDEKSPEGRTFNYLGSTEQLPEVKKYGSQADVNKAIKSGRTLDKAQALKLVKKVPSDVAKHLDASKFYYDAQKAVIIARNSEQGLIYFFGDKNAVFGHGFEYLGNSDDLPEVGKYKNQAEVMQAIKTGKPMNMTQAEKLIKSIPKKIEAHIEASKLYYDQHNGVLIARNNEQGLFYFFG